MLFSSLFCYFHPTPLHLSTLCIYCIPFPLIRNSHLPAPPVSPPGLIRCSTCSFFCSATLTRCLVPRCSKDRPGMLRIMEWNVGVINPQGCRAKTQECVNERDKTPFSRVSRRRTEDYAFTGRGFGDLQPRDVSRMSRGFAVEFPHLALHKGLH